MKSKKAGEHKCSTIRLKLLQSQKTYPPDEDPETFVFECLTCRAQTTKLGAIKDMHTNDPKYVCEPCAIDQYKAANGFRSREAAKARRRRIFDVPYLFQDMFLQEYLKRKKIAYKDIGAGAFEQVFVLSREAYGALFGPELREYLEELEQWELEIIFRNFVEHTPRELLDGIDPYSVPSSFDVSQLLPHKNT